MQPGLNRAALRVVILSSLGGALEFYDFVVYGIFAAYISQAFFPAGDPVVSLLATYSLLAVGYLARPVGGLVFGRRGDRSGRRGSFMLSLGIMSAATVLMGLVPSYATGGVAATAAFVLLRIVQGFCLGGELPGAITYAVEIVPARRTTLACGIVFGCVSAGVLLAAAVNTLLHAFLPETDIAAYGWRIAFILGGLFGAGSWFLRRTLAESPAFLAMQAEYARMGASRAPLRTLFRSHGNRIIIAVLATSVVAMFNGLLFAHMPAYLIRTLNDPPQAAVGAINLCVLVTCLALAAGAALGDLVSRRVLFQVGCLIIAAGALPAYNALARHSMDLSTLFVLIGLSTCFTHGIFAALLADVFPTEVRFSGVAFSLNIGAVIFSSFAPLLATALIAATGDLAAPGWLLQGTAVLAFVASFAVRGIEGELKRV